MDSSRQKIMLQGSVSLLLHCFAANLNTSRGTYLVESSLSICTVLTMVMVSCLPMLSSSGRNRLQYVSKYAFGTPHCNPSSIARRINVRFSFEMAPGVVWLVSMYVVASTGGLGPSP